MLSIHSFGVTFASCLSSLLSITRMCQDWSCIIILFFQICLSFPCLSWHLTLSHFNGRKHPQGFFQPPSVYPPPGVWRPGASCRCEPCCLWLHRHLLPALQGSLRWLTQRPGGGGQTPDAVTTGPMHKSCALQPLNWENRFIVMLWLGRYRGWPDWSAGKDSHIYTKASRSCKVTNQISATILRND